MNAETSLVTLQTLAASPRWVSWRNELQPDGKLRKTPYMPGESRKAEVDNPETWRPRDEAIAHAELIVDPDLGGGVGLELGDLGNGLALGGVDLDTCRAPGGTIDDWAVSVIQRLATYAEVSPSGTGVKCFFVYETIDQGRLREAMRSSGSQGWGRQWKKAGNGHPPGIELYIGRRYFAETRQHLPFTRPDFRVVTADELLHLIQVVGPAFVGTGNKAGKSAGFDDLNGPNDRSRSGWAFKLGAKARREGKTFEEMEAIIRDHPETADWYREKASKDSGRQVHRIWEKVDPETIDNAEWTEDGVARAFVTKHQDTLRHDHDGGRWYEWNGRAWREDRTARGFSWARIMCREIRQNSGAPDGLAKASVAAAVERFARSDPAMAVTSAHWDRDPWLLGTPDGTVDLRTGQLRAANPDDCITKLTAVGPADVPECPRWLQFLGETTGGDHALIRFLRQWIGYSLTGDTREHALLFVFGPGGNGKSVLLSTTAGILGDYARTAPMEAFVASASDRHATELAMLRGARLVSASETEEGRAWAEVRIKQLTGGDVIAARFMRQDFFEYRPQFKLTIVGNHKPLLRNVDEAARRRFNVVPFLFKPTTVDRDLEAKLRAEWPSILRWAIEGCLDWRRNGLVRPAVVTEATDEYFQAQDHFARWLEECCVLDPSGGLKTKPSLLLKSFNDWCAENGEDHSDNKRLRGQIERSPKLKYVTVQGTQFVRGVGLRVEGGGE